MDESDGIFNPNLCFVCHLTVRDTTLKKCSSCKSIYYCSDAHQRIHWKSHSRLCKIIGEINSKIKPENLEDNVNWYKYRTNMLMLCELKLGKKMKLHEVNMILFPNTCQICRQKNNLKACLKCLGVSYCSEKHRQIDFEFHKEVCHLFALCLELDLHLSKTHLYPNYSLWGENIKLLDSMDQFIETNITIKEVSALTSQQKKALVSELVTCPLSLLFALTNISYIILETFVIHVIGSSYLETASLKSWEIILHTIPLIQNLVIYFIGPEIQINDDVNLCSSCKEKLTFKYSNDLYHVFVHNPLYEEPNVICSFNCGFHEFENSSMDTWDKTLNLLSGNFKVPLVFTSFTESEVQKDSNALLKKNKNLKINILKNKFSSLRPYRDLESLNFYFNNRYIGIVSYNALK